MPFYSPKKQAEQEAKSQAEIAAVTAKADALVHVVKPMLDRKMKLLEIAAELTARGIPPITGAKKWTPAGVCHCVWAVKRAAAKSE